MSPEDTEDKIPDTAHDDAVETPVDAQPEATAAREVSFQDGSASSAQISPINWSASEYIAHEKTAGWYALLATAGAASVIVIFAITRDYLASIVVLLAFVAIMIYASRKPETKSYLIDDKGVHIDEKSYSFSQFRSFSVVEEGAINSIWLAPLRRLKPMVIMYCSKEDETKIADTLSLVLPHEERELDAIDRFAKRVRF